jgi:hypothetical protein
MYALLNPNPFNTGMQLKILIPNFPPIYATDGSTVIPYTHEQMLKITVKFVRKKKYHNTATNIYCACYGVLDTHINNAFKVAPSTNPPTVGWNTSMSLNKIFDQLMKRYSCPIPDAMCQNMMTFLALHNPQDPPELLFK